MTPFNATLLCLFMFFAIGLGALGVYTAGAGADYQAVDGYGINRTP